MEIQIHRNSCSSMETRKAFIDTSSNPTDTCSIEIKIYRDSCSPTETRVVSINISTNSTGTCFYKVKFLSVLKIAEVWVRASMTIHPGVLNTTDLLTEGTQRRSLPKGGGKTTSSTKRRNSHIKAPHSKCP